LLGKFSQLAQHPFLVGQGEIGDDGKDYEGNDASGKPNRVMFLSSTWSVGVGKGFTVM
jgi:hypothetical protein